MTAAITDSDRPSNGQRRPLVDLLVSARGLLPNGANDQPETFQARHNVGLVVAVFLWLLIGIVGMMMAEDLPHHFAELIPMTIALALAFVAKDRRFAALYVVFVYMAACSLLIHLTNGLIESHFLFFVLLPVISLYQDWRAFLAAIGFVVFHHFVVGLITPSSVYNHPDAIENPLKWGLLHAAYFVALIMALVVEWNFSEASQRLATKRLEDLQTAQEELMQAQKMESVGQLAAGIAHEINTPMQYIGDNTHFLKATVTRLLTVAAAAETATAEGATAADLDALAAVLKKSKVPILASKAPKAAEDALAGVDSVSSIVTAMKRFSHPDSDEMEQVNLNDALRTTMTVSRNEWKYCTAIETDLDPNLPTIAGHHSKLNQVWLNMIVNASHAIQERHGDAMGMITISTALAPDRQSVVVRIGDNGSGIAPENVSKVFDHFFTTKEVGKGTGQGLSLAYGEIVDKHRGDIDIESTLGLGTTFVITLPIEQPASTVPEAMAAMS